MMLPIINHSFILIFPGLELALLYFYTEQANPFTNDIIPINPYPTLKFI